MYQNDVEEVLQYKQHTSFISEMRNLQETFKIFRNVLEKCYSAKIVLLFR